MNGSIFIHMGYPHCASTFLQKQIFMKLKDFKYIGNKAHQCRNKFFFPTEKTFYKAIAMKYTNNLILSNEHFAGTKWGDEKINWVKLLSSVFPDANVILVTRNKREWVNCMYHYYMNVTGKHIDFEYWYDNILNHKFLDIDSLINSIQENFNGRLIVEPFENLVNDHRIFVNNICSFMNVPIPAYENIKVHATDYDRYKLKV